MEQARADGVPVLLEGQGADELLGGYPQHAALALREHLASAWRLRKGAVRELYEDYRGFADTFSARTLQLWVMRQALPFLRVRYRRRVGALGTLRPEFVRAQQGHP